MPGRRVFLSVALAASLFTVAEGCTSPPMRAAEPPAPAAGWPETTPAPMAGLERLTGGEWTVTFASGQKASHAFEWGPGRYSLRKVAGWASPDGEWGGEVMYWDSGAARIRVLTMHPDIPAVGRGVGSGTTQVRGDVLEGLVELHQPRGRRNLLDRVTFTGPDSYINALLEASGPAGYEPLAEWTFTRRWERGERVQKPDAAAPPSLPGRLAGLEPFVGRTWDAADGARRFRSEVRWAGALEAVLVRTVDARGVLCLDAYVYRDVQFGEVRCLALTRTGGVYEGRLSLNEGGAVEFEMTGRAPGVSAPGLIRARVETRAEGKPRFRVWSGSEPGALECVLDLVHAATDSEAHAARGEQPTER